MQDDSEKTIVGEGNPAGGATLAGRYRVVKQLGAGGMGSVWLAEDTLLDGKKFALKMLPPVLVANKRAYNQLKAEALVAMKLTHPNIVTLRAFEENNGNPFLVMDYIDGVTLDDHLAERGRLPEAEVLRLLKPVAAALDYAHAEGVVHRDVKPANVMIRKDGHPFILDFGIAREIQETLTRVTGKLSSGTLLYMSPEQLSGEQPAPAQDVYSFAAMAYECLKGEPPFARGQIEYQILHAPPPPLPPDNAQARIAATVLAGLAKTPEARPLTCAGVLIGRPEGPAIKLAGEEPNGTARRSAAPGRAASPLAATPPAHGDTRPSPARSSKFGVFVFGAALLALIGAGLWRLTTVNTPAAHSPARPLPAVAALPAPAKTPTAAPAKTETPAHAENETQTPAPAPAENETPAPANLTAGPSGRPPAHAAPRDEDAQAALARLATLRTQITIKTADAKAKMASLAAYRDDPDFQSRVAAADAPFRIATAVRDAPRTVADAEAALRQIDAAETQIALALHWVEMNKAARDAARAAADAITRDIAPRLEKYDAARCVPALYAAGARLRQDGAAALAKGDFPAARDAYTGARAKLADAAAQARAFTFKTTLAAAQQFFDAGHWQDCVASCDKILTDDAGHQDARRLKAKAAQHLKPPEPKHGDTRTLMLPGGAQLEMIYVAPGSFLMGSPSDEAGRDDDETRHRVTLTKGYWLGKYEVTQAQWRSVMGDNPSNFKGDDRPVENVSWEDCQQFIRKVNDAARRQFGGDARLPTEAEWEYACRAGTTTAYFGGNALNGDRANCDGNYPCGTTVKGPYRKTTSPVGTYAPNAWGFHDMHGNVWEWCNDWYGSYNGDATDPTGSASGTRRVVRGGGWNGNARYCRAANRIRNAPGVRIDYLGFRLCCSAGLRHQGSGTEGAHAQAKAAPAEPGGLPRVSAEKIFRKIGS